MKKIKYTKLSYNKAKIITTAVKVKDGGATTVPTACAIALRDNSGKWHTEADMRPAGASVPVYRYEDGGIPARVWAEMWQYLANIAERNLSRCGELLSVYGGEIHAAHIRRVQAAAARYAASLANCRVKIETYKALAENRANDRRMERERKEAEIVRNGSAAYVDNAAEKATIRFSKIEERVNKREAAKAANAVKAA